MKTTYGLNFKEGKQNKQPLKLKRKEQKKQLKQKQLPKLMPNVELQKRRRQLRKQQSWLKPKLRRGQYWSRRREKRQSWLL